MSRLRGVCRPFVPIVHIDRLCRLLSPIFFVRIFYIGSLRAAGHAPIIFSTGLGVMCCHKKLPAINVAGRVYSDTRRTSRCVWSPYRIDMCADRIDMYAGRVLNGTGEGCPPFYPVISSPCIQKRCAAVVTSLSASNELHMIVCIQMFFVQKNFRLPDCIHCRRTLCGALSLSRVSIYRLLYMFVCLVNLLSCFSSLAVCLFSHASMSYPCLHVYAYILYGVFHSSRAVPFTVFVSAPFAACSLSGSVGRGRGAKSDTDPFR